MIELWSSNHDAYSHRCRFIICEKNSGLERGIGVSVRDIDISNKTEDLARINPNNQVPVLIDRELLLRESSIICEYLDERFPHPQLMPTSVADKARARLLIHELDEDFYPLMSRIISSKSSKTDDYRNLLAERLLDLSQRLSKSKFLLGNDLSVADIALVPLLWRLEFLGVNLPPRAAPLLKYAETVFSSDGFISSMTPAEKEMRS